MTLQEHNAKRRLAAPVGAKNRRQKAKESLAKAISKLVDMGYTPERMEELTLAYLEARKEKVL